MIVVDRRAVIGYELRLRGLNPRFAGYGGVRLHRQALGAMFASGAIAGLVGAPEWLSPLVAILPAQALAAQVGADRGVVIDEPFGLRKVTRTV